MLEIKTRYAESHCAVDGIDLERSCGEPISLPGPSGCARRTLRRCFADLVPRGERTAVIDGGLPAPHDHGVTR